MAIYTLEEPTRVLLGERHVWKESGAKQRCISKEDDMFYIPVLKTLQVLLSNETVLSEVRVQVSLSCKRILYGHFTRYLNSDIYYNAY